MKDKHRLLINNLHVNNLHVNIDFHLKTSDFNLRVYNQLHRAVCILNLYFFAFAETHLPVAEYKVLELLKFNSENPSSSPQVVITPMPPPPRKEP